MLLPSESISFEMARSSSVKRYNIRELNTFVGAVERYLSSEECDKNRVQHTMSRADMILLFSSGGTDEYLRTL